MRLTASEASESILMVLAGTLSLTSSDGGDMMKR